MWALLDEFKSRVDSLCGDNGWPQHGVNPQQPRSLTGRLNIPETVHLGIKMSLQKLRLGQKRYQHWWEELEPPTLSRGHCSDYQRPWRAAGILKELKEASHPVGLKMNLRKTKIMNPNNIQIILDNTTVEKVDLGSKLPVRRGNRTMEINRSSKEWASPGRNLAGSLTYGKL